MTDNAGRIRWWSRGGPVSLPKTKELLTSFSVHVLRTGTMLIHVHTAHQYVSYTRKQRRSLHVGVTTICRTYRRQTFGKETDGENESSSRVWMGMAALTRRRQRNRGRLPYGYTESKRGRVKTRDAALGVRRSAAIATVGNFELENSPHRAVCPLALLPRSLCDTVFFSAYRRLYCERA